MILVGDFLISDIARKHSQISRLAAKKGLQGDHDASMEEFFSGGVDKGSFLKEISKFSEQRADEDLL